MNNKYEQLVEFIINDETDKARELFHQIVVEKSRDIYENLVAEEDLAEVGGNEVEELVDEISLDEEGISEEEEGEEGAEELAGAEEAELGAEEGDAEELEDRVVDLESALDELKAEFDALMAGEEHEEEAMPGIHGDDDGEMAEMHGGMNHDAMQEEEFYEAEEKDEDKDKEDDKEVDESIVREYVEKVATPANSEGAAVGTGKSVAVNKKSTVAGKNDMGGKAVNVTAGGSANQDGNSPAASEKPKGQLVNDPLNKPGANAGKAFSSKAKAKTGEEGGINKHSIEPGGN
jgi:hypothetical protein